MAAPAAEAKVEDELDAEILQVRARSVGSTPVRLC